MTDATQLATTGLDSELDALADELADVLEDERLALLTGDLDLVARLAETKTTLTESLMQAMTGAGGRGRCRNRRRAMPGQNVYGARPLAMANCWPRRRRACGPPVCVCGNWRARNRWTPMTGTAEGSSWAARPLAWPAAPERGIGLRCPVFAAGKAPDGMAAAAIRLSLC